MTHKIDKKIILSFIIACTVLCLTKSMFFNWKSKLSIWTNVKEDTNISVEYRRKETSPLNHVKIEKQVNGKFVLKLRGNKTSYVKINVPKNVQIEKVRYSGLKSKDIILDKSKSAQLENYLARPHVCDWYNFIVIFVVSFYFTWFLFSAWEHRYDPKEPEKIPSMMNIEFLRCLFCFNIVLGHSFEIMKKGFINFQGVPFFFLLSGFLFCCTFNQNRSIYDYIKSKIVNWIPLISFGAILKMILVEQIQLSEFLPNILFYAQTNLHPHFGYNAPSWFLSNLFWVLLFFFYTRKTFLEKESNYIFCIITFLSICAFFNKQQSFIHRNTLMAFMYVGLGYFTAKVYKEIIKYKNFNEMIYTTLEVSFLAIAFSAFIKNLFINQIISTFGHMVLIILFTLKRGSLSRWIEKNFSQKFSRYVLSIYLTHVFTVQGILPRLYANPHLNKIMNIYYVQTIFITIIISFLLAIIAHHAIEKPGAKLMKRWLE